MTLCSVCMFTLEEMNSLLEMCANDILVITRSSNSDDFKVMLADLGVDVEFYNFWLQGIIVYLGARRDKIRVLSSCHLMETLGILRKYGYLHRIIALKGVVIYIPQLIKRQIVEIIFQHTHPQSFTTSVYLCFCFFLGEGTNYSHP